MLDYNIYIIDIDFSLCLTLTKSSYGFHNNHS